MGCRRNLSMSLTSRPISTSSKGWLRNISHLAQRTPLRMRGFGNTLYGSATSSSTANGALSNLRVEPWVFRALSRELHLDMYREAECEHNSPFQFGSCTCMLCHRARVGSNRLLWTVISYQQGLWKGLGTVSAAEPLCYAAPIGTT
jgi:hypothetical protein